MRTMATFAVVGCLIVLTVVAPPSAAADGTLRSADVDGVAVYQFRGDYLGDSATVHEARIDYELDGRVLLSKRFSFSVEAGGAATFLVPSPTSVLGLTVGPATALEIHVYVGDTLVDSFDLARFEEYSRHLERTDPVAVDRLVRTYLRQAEEAGAAPVVEAPVRLAQASAAGPQVGSKALDPCVQACRQEYFDCSRNDGSGCEQQFDYCLLGCPNWDSDGDGVLNGSDNCDTVPNANQANCDGDAYGDVCDGLNANYQDITGEQTCWTDKDSHVVYFTFEHHVEWLERDVSSCGAPDRWQRKVRKDNDCVGISDYDCCIGLRFSISAVGDDPFYWCSAQIRDYNFCH